jgi:excisionase family DNA binding protein
MEDTLTSKQAAERLGVTPARVRQMILEGTLPAGKFGRDLVIKSSDLALVADRPLGRPPKAKLIQSNGKKRGKK